MCDGSSSGGLGKSLVSGALGLWAQPSLGLTAFGWPGVLFVPCFSVGLPWPGAASSVFSCWFLFGLGMWFSHKSGPACPLGPGNILIFPSLISFGLG